MKPIEEIIPRTSDVQDTLDKFVLAIEDVTNFGSNVIKWDLETTRGNDEKMPVLLLFRHFLELLDSVGVLVKSSSIDPAKLILRGMLETYFGLDYIFEKDSDDRSMAFLTCHYHKKHKVYRNLDPSSPSNSQFLREIQNDKSYDTLDLSRIPNIQAAIANLESLFQRPLYQKAEAEYQRLVANKVKNPVWYQFFGGPSNVRDLAKHLKLSGLYEILYRYWSGSTHSTDVIDGKITRSQTGEGFDLIQIRFVKDAQSITSYALTISLKVLEVYIKNRVPNKEEAYKDWYETVRDFYLRISSKDRIIDVQV